MDDLIDITNLHKQHFTKLDDISNQLATMFQVNKVHISKITDLMEQKFSAAVAFSEQLIHTAYSHQLSAGALHHEALLVIINYVNEVAIKIRCSPS